MGMYYSFGAAYGVAGEFTHSNDLEDLPGRLKSLAEEHEDFLYDEGVRAEALSLPSGVELSVGGDFMCGDYYWALLVKETVTEISRDDFFVLAALPAVSMEQAQALSDAMSHLEIDGDPSWLLMGNLH